MKLQSWEDIYMGGKNINLFLLDGVPEGCVKCTLSNWTGVAYKIPRTELDKCKERADLSQSGIYFLFGVEEEGEKPVVYVGQADVRKNGNGLLGRLQEHRRNPDKDYWTEAIVFTTSNNFLGATEISWLESHFCSFAKKANRYVVKNGNEPSSGKPKEETVSDLETFVDYAKIVMGVLGHKVFEPKVPITTNEAQEGSSSQVFYCKRNNLEGKGVPTSEGFVLLAGSRVSLEVADYVPKGYKKLRERYATLIDANGILSEDIPCSSPSAAAVFVIGKNANGLTEWKTLDGKTLNEFESGT